MSTSSAGYHHGDLRAALVAAALPLLRSGGAAALSLRGLARAAGVSPMAPYRHFADKDALLAAIAAQGFELFTARLDAATRAQADPRAALVAQGAAYVRFACEERALFRLMFGPLITSAEAQATLRESGSAAYALLERAVAALVAEPARQKLAVLASWSIVHGLSCLLVDGKIAVPDPDDRHSDGMDAVERMAGAVLWAVPLS